MNVFKEKGITCLDLHGEKHDSIYGLVLDFVYRFQDEIPLLIICGNSKKMIDLVVNSLTTNEIKNGSPRYGIVRVEGFN